LQGFAKGITMRKTSQGMETVKIYQFGNLFIFTIKIHYDAIKKN